MKYSSMTSSELQAIKDNLRIGFSEDDNLIKMYWASAEDYICTEISIHATPERLSEYPMYKACVQLLATHWYSSRMTSTLNNATKVKSSEIPFGVSNIIYNLRVRFINDSKFAEYEDEDLQTNTTQK